MKRDEIESFIQQMRKHMIEQALQTKWTLILAMADMSLIVHQ